MDTVSYEEIRDHLGDVMAKVVNDHAPVIITRHHHAPVVMVRLDAFNSWKETEYLTRSPANAKDLQEAVDDVKNHRNLVKQERIEV